VREPKNPEGLSRSPIVIHDRPDGLCIPTGEKPLAGSQQLSKVSFINITDMVNKNDSAQQEPKKEIIRSVRYTPNEDAVLDAKCATCGQPKSVFIHDTSLGYNPPQLMTDGQEEALKSLSAARSELIGIRNALNARSQEQRKRLFRNDQFMQVWMDGVNALIREWKTIQDHFTGIHR